jgi:alkylation response protein AidB-like acyl-CoA dehydrogenase
MTDGASAADEQVRREVREWLAENWGADVAREQWRDRLIDSGWAAPTWPVDCYGRGLPTSARKVVNEEFAAVGALGTGLDAFHLWANVIVSLASEAQRAAFLRPLLTGEHRGCLLYSEPGAGSDLAGLQTRADRDGEDWIVTGQKVWTSGAHESTHGLLIARTDWDVPKHRGLTFFWFPMQQPGVEVRPIRQVTGGAEFNEVFIDAARVPDANRLSEVGAGWGALLVALGHERQIMGGTSFATAASSAPRELTAEEKKARRESAMPGRAGGVDYVELARATGKNTDPVMRQRIAALFTLERANQWTTQRARADRGASSSLASLSKLAMSRILHSGAQLTSDLLGAESVLEGEHFEEAAEINRSSFAAFFNSIGGGTDQIQRNIIGERILGLPKEPELDREVPFRDVRKADPARRTT